MASRAESNALRLRLVTVAGAFLVLAAILSWPVWEPNTSYVYVASGSCDGQGSCLVTFANSGLGQATVTGLAIPGYALSPDPSFSVGGRDGTTTVAFTISPPPGPSVKLLSGTIIIQGAISRALLVRVA